MKRKVIIITIGLSFATAVAGFPGFPRGSTGDVVTDLVSEVGFPGRSADRSMQGAFYLELAPGFCWVPPVPLTIRQEGHPSIFLWARYNTASFRLPLYYSIRMGYQSGAKGWEAEMNHLKVYLKNNPPEVGKFSVSHGYNQFFVNRLFRRNEVDLRAGAGVVVAHPENTVRGHSLEEQGGLFNKGYYLAGPALLGGISRKAGVASWLYFHFSGSITVAWARVKVSGGRASVPVMAFQLQIAPGIRIWKDWSGETGP